jgi:hypothetical protein
LSNLLDGWETTSDAHLRRLGKHSTDMHFVAADFADTEACNTEAVRRVGEAASGKSPRR